MRWTVLSESPDFAAILALEGKALVPSSSARSARHSITSRWFGSKMLSNTMVMTLMLMARIPLLSY